MLNILGLELWKQRKTFFSTLLVLALGVAGPAILLPTIRSVRTGDSFTGAAAFLILVLPLVIVFLGASAAASLRKTEDKIHEELLPVHPYLRVYGAYIASFFYTAFISLLAISLLGVQERFYLTSLEVGLFQLPVGMLLLYTWSLHCLSFVISYVLNLPVLGAGLALILSTVDFFFRGVLFLLKRNVLAYYFGEQLSNSLTWLPLTFFIPLGLVLISSAIAARRLERGLKLGIKTGFLLFLCFLVSPVWSLLIVFTLSVVVASHVLGYGESFWSFFWDTMAAFLN